MYNCLYHVESVGKAVSLRDAFLTYDVTKVVPTKVNLVSHMYVIQHFV